MKEPRRVAELIRLGDRLSRVEEFGGDAAALLGWTILWEEIRHYLERVDGDPS